VAGPAPPCYPRARRRLVWPREAFERQYGTLFAGVQAMVRVVLELASGLRRIEGLSDANAFPAQLEVSGVVTHILVRTTPTYVVYRAVAPIVYGQE